MTKPIDLAPINCLASSNWHGGQSVICGKRLLCGHTHPKVGCSNPCDLAELICANYAYPLSLSRGIHQYLTRVSHPSPNIPSHQIGGVRFLKGVVSTKCRYSDGGQEERETKEYILVRVYILFGETLTPDPKIQQFLREIYVSSTAAKLPAPHGPW